MEANLDFEIDDKGANIFHLAVFRGSLAMVKMLMSCKMLPLDKKNDMGRNAVHIATMHDRLDILKYLLTKHETRLQH